MEAQCELLISNFKDPKTIALVKETIEHIPDGPSSQCADALKLWLKKAFELKKQKVLESGVQLRCTRVGCERHDQPVSYRLAGSSVYCESCYRNYYSDRYMECSGCRYRRTVVTHTSCGSCGKKFM